MQICLGRMQMSLDQFWSSEPREIFLAITGWHRQQEDEFKRAAEQSRLMSYYAVMPYAGKGKLRKPSDLYPLPWDPAGKKVEVTREEFKRITHDWDKDMIGPDGKFR